MTKDYSKLTHQERYYLHAAGVKGVWKKPKKKKVRRSQEKGRTDA